MSAVFISYSSKDHHVARRLCLALEAREIVYWIASRDVQPGENFGEAIVTAIASAKLMALVFTVNANESDEIKKELALASQVGLPVIPVRTEDAAPSGAFKYELATRQWIDLFEAWDTGFERLHRRVHHVLSSHDSASAVKRPETEDFRQDNSDPKFSIDPGFDVGESVVHPDHGVGVIREIEQQEIAGFRLKLLVVDFSDSTVLRIPSTYKASYLQRLGKSG